MKLTMKSVTPKLKRAVRNYLLARAIAELRREKFDQMEREVLASDNYQTNPKLSLAPARRITDPDEYWLMDPGDSIRFQIACQARIQAMGYKTQPGGCPFLDARNTQIRAEQVVIAEGAKMVGEDPENFQNGLLCLGLDKYEECIKLFTRLVASLPDFKNPVEEFQNRKKGGAA